METLQDAFEMLQVGRDMLQQLLPVVRVLWNAPAWGPWISNAGGKQHPMPFHHPPGNKQEGKQPLKKNYTVESTWVIDSL